MMGSHKCEHCGWELQAVIVSDLVEFRIRELPLIHCIHCDKLPFMSDPGHTPPTDAYR